MAFNLTWDLDGYSYDLPIKIFLIFDVESYVVFFFVKFFIILIFIFAEFLGKDFEIQILSLVTVVK